MLKKQDADKEGRPTYIDGKDTIFLVLINSRRKKCHGAKQSK